MSKRRPSGDGMVRHREDGRWEGRIVIGHKENGDPIFHYLSARSQKALLEKLRQAQAEYQGVDLCEDCTMALGDWLNRWLNGYAASAVRESTLTGYRRYLETYVEPRLGKVQICKLTTGDIQKLYQELEAHGRIRRAEDGGTGLSPATIRGIHGVLHQALDAAVRERLIPRNPTEGVVLPQKAQAPMKILNDEQLDRFMAELKKDPLWHDLFYVEITTGLRRGELCGLMWRDLDAKAGTLSICRSVHSQAGGGLTTGETKTHQGKRRITLPPSTVELLRTRRKSSCSPWIFPDPIRPELPISPQRAYTRLKEILKSAELPDLRFHDLRHTFATHALSSGVDAKTLSGILGHTKASFTLDTYTHVTGDMHRRAAEVVGGFLERVMVR